MPDRACAVCGAELEPKAGPGRPPTYCGEPCRRMAEWRVRQLTKRIDRYEQEVRELHSGGTRFGYWPDDQIGRRMRDLRRWIKQDTARLGELFGRQPDGK